MKEAAQLLNSLLDKYERSSHLHAPGASNRRVMLRMTDYAPYDYEHAPVRDAYNEAAQALEELGLVMLTWVFQRPVLKEVVLNLARLTDCYAQAGRVHPATRAMQFAAQVREALAQVQTPWILAWRDAVCEEAQTQWKIPAAWQEQAALSDLLDALRCYDQCTESLTMRAFSSRCYHDTKHFESHVREAFLRVARAYCPELQAACDARTLSARDQLAVLGIYANAELYELSGDCLLRTAHGELNLGAAGADGLALPSTLVDALTEVDLHDMLCITFIENRTNYEAYLRTEKQPRELVIYHGGFLSRQKRKLFSLLVHAAPKETQLRFWADIDAGGFRMFRELQELAPQLTAMRMSAEDVERLHASGLKRDAKYLEALREMQGEYPLFAEAITAIVKYGVTIEQEAFLNGVE